MTVYVIELNFRIEWAGERPEKRKVPGIRYSLILKVPSSSGGRLIKALAEIEPRVARSSGYQVKLVEKSGKPLSHYYPQGVSKDKCHKAWCSVVQKHRRRNLLGVIKNSVPRCLSIM